MASVCAASCLRLGIDGSRLAVASYVPTSTSGALIDGALKCLVDWDGGIIEEGKTRSQTENELFEILSSTSIFSLVDIHDDNTLLPHQRLAVSKLITMEHDAVVKRTYRSEAHRLLRYISRGGTVDKKIMSGGHVSASLRRHKIHTKLIEETILEMLAIQKSDDVTFKTKESTTSDDEQSLPSILSKL